MRLQVSDSTQDWILEQCEGLGLLYRSAKDHETELKAVDALMEVMRLGQCRADTWKNNQRIFA